MKPMTRLNLNIPIDLKCEIKKRSAMRNITMRKYIIKALLQYIKKEQMYE